MSSGGNAGRVGFLSLGMPVSDYERQRSLCRKQGRLRWAARFLDTRQASAVLAAVVVRLLARLTLPLVLLLLLTAFVRVLAGIAVVLGLALIVLSHGSFLSYCPEWTRERRAARRYRSARLLGSPHYAPFAADKIALTLAVATSVSSPQPNRLFPSAVRHST